MLIFGFADTYGNCDISNENGAVDFIKFFDQHNKRNVLRQKLFQKNKYLLGNSNGIQEQN